MAENLLGITKLRMMSYKDLWNFLILDVFDISSTVIKISWEKIWDTSKWHSEKFHKKISNQEMGL